MRAGRDVARILHHVGQELAEQRGVDRVDLVVALADRLGLLHRAGGIDVEHFLELHQRQLGQVLEPAAQLARHAGALDGDDALGGVLAEIADALQFGGDADRAHDLAQVGRHWLALGDGEDRLLVDLALGIVEDDVLGDDLLRQRAVGGDEGAHGVRHHLLGGAAHFGNAAGEIFQFFVIDRDDMGRWHGLVLNTPGFRDRPASAEAAHDVVPACAGRPGW